MAVDREARYAALLLEWNQRLNLTGARTAEELARHPAHREAFDRAISRAAARPAVLLELALPFVRVGGDLLAVVGEVEAGPLGPAARRLGADPPWIERTRDGRPLLRTRKRQA